MKIAANLEAVSLDDANYIEIYSLACDAVYRTLHPGIDDGLRHTSREARAVAWAMFDAIGLKPQAGIIERTMDRHGPDGLARMAAYVRESERG